MKPTGLLERFLSRIEATDDCWNWLGSTIGLGYGQLELGRRRKALGRRIVIGAHRLSVLLSGREIPRGMTVDHLCRNRRCVRPSHLEVVSQQANIGRGMAPSAVAARSGICQRGHMDLRMKSNGKRACYECVRTRERARRRLAATVAGLMICFGLAAQTASPVYAGYWHANSVAIPHYAPCPANGLAPYTAFVDPDTGLQGYFRYDFSSYRFPISQCPGGATPPCQFASAGGPNHSTTWVPSQGDQKNMEVPIWAQQQPPNYYPAPTGASDVCAQWVASGNTVACPGSESYVNAMRNNPVYSAGYQLKLPAINADPGCQSGAVTATPTKVPTPAKTPTPAPNQFQDWIYEAVAEKLMAGCGATTFCPGDNALTWQGIVTRGQQAVYLLKLKHSCDAACPDYVPPPCTPPGKFTDVPCVH